LQPVPRIFVGNFDFEWVLSDHPRTPPASVLRSCAEMAPVWLGIAEQGDSIWTPEPIDDAFFAELAAVGLPRMRCVSTEADVPAGTVVCPWGWTEAIRVWAGRQGWAPTAPPPEAVRRGNSRRFSFELETEWGVGLPGATLIHQPRDVADALRKLSGSADRWVMKAEFGMSARERLLGSGGELTAAARAWLRKRLAHGAVVLEPWVERLAEAGMQFEIPPYGPPRLVGIAPLLTDRAGSYRGSRFGTDPSLEDEWAGAITVCRRAASRLQDLGYFGPAGIDAMRYRAADGAIRVRPLQDINARWTMGRLALGFSRLLQPGWWGTWLHVRLPKASAATTEAWLNGAHTAAGRDVRMIPTSPALVAGQPVRHRTSLLLAKSREALLRAEFAMQSMGGALS
jgi:hypothetical protein